MRHPIRIGDAPSYPENVREGYPPPYRTTRLRDGYTCPLSAVPYSFSVGQTATQPPETTDMGTFVTHLESALDGTRFDADQVHTVHQGRPLWVRYDLPQI